MKFRTKLKSRLFSGMFNGFNPARFDTLVGAGTTVGSIIYAGTLKVDGTCRNISVSDTEKKKSAQAVIVSKGGEVWGDIKDADFVIVAGYVTGNVYAKKQLIVKAGGVIVGDIIYGDLVIETGAHINGRMAKDGWFTNDVAQPSIVEDPDNVQTAMST